VKVRDITPEWIERARSYPPGMLDPRQALDALAVAIPLLRNIASFESRFGPSDEAQVARLALDTEIPGGET